jgi:hypothetical protein
VSHSITRIERVEASAGCAGSGSREGLAGAFDGPGAFATERDSTAQGGAGSLSVGAAADTARTSRAGTSDCGGDGERCAGGELGGCAGVALIGVLRGAVTPAVRVFELGEDNGFTAGGAGATRVRRTTGGLSATGSATVRRCGALRGVAVSAAGVAGFAGKARLRGGSVGGGESFMRKV